MKGFKLMSFVAILVLTVGFAQQASAACQTDINSDGFVDAVDWLAMLSAWGPCPGPCPADTNADGVVDAIDWLAMLSEWGECPQETCPEDIPDYYEQADEHARAAGGVCVEYAGVDGPGACPFEDFSSFLDDQNYILNDYPFANAIFDGSTGGGQAFREVPFSILCVQPDNVPNAAETFDDLNACYHATTDCLFGCEIAIIDFDWAVNVSAAVDEYQALVAPQGGYCELDIYNGAATGFHAQEGALGYREYTVRATDQCDLFGCRCDATLTMLADPASGTYVEMALENNSGCIDGTCCDDPRFSF